MHNLVADALLPSMACQPGQLIHMTSSQGALCSALADRKNQLVARQDPTEYFCIDCIDMRPYHMAYYETAMLCG